MRSPWPSRTSPRSGGLACNEGRKRSYVDDSSAFCANTMTPLVFLHGVGGGHHAWEGQLPYFAGLGYPSHAWDQPGYGHSPGVEPYDLERISASLARLIESLGGEPVVL